ncbi:nicotinamide N-methyltransferase-like [Daphnia pulicaria]|uniref:nicotinamide N-methyltransferase-like n=1 Tax=Daphnia pulicaria TaxID=35523 RepID=UPI001EEA609C|nr:nicotinamide N-methyltransferase-like [Daphnia pulicaria]
MASKEENKTLSQVYQEEFQPDYYINRYYSGIDAGNEFCLKNLHQFFEQECGENKNRKKVLEVGSGPVPLYVMSASRWSNSIVCSDFLQQNREKLTQWLSDGREADEIWSSYALYVAQLESESADKESAFLVLDRVRHSVRCVIPCDVLQSDPILGHTESPFDIIISVFCLECAVSSPKEYPSTVSNVVRLLNPSGHLIMMGGLEGEHYFIRDRKIPRIKLTREMINLALQNAGCEIVTWHELPRNLRPPELPIDYTAMFFCVAKKIC